MNEALESHYRQYYQRPITLNLRNKADQIERTENAFIVADETTPSSPAGVLDKELERFYSALKYWELRWKTLPGAPVEMEGAFNILPVNKVLNAAGWDLLPDEFPRMKDFTILDYFYDEAAVGLYLNQPEKGLFYFGFDADPRPLNLDFKGYLEMLKYTRGAAYWQTTVIAPADRASNSVIEKLEALFPEVSVKGFYELYDSVKLKQ